MTWTLDYNVEIAFWFKDIYPILMTNISDYLKELYMTRLYIYFYIFF